MILYTGVIGEYDRLTLEESKQVATNFSNMLEFARNH